MAAETSSGVALKDAINDAIFDLLLRHVLVVWRRESVWEIAGLVLVVVEAAEPENGPPQGQQQNLCLSHPRALPLC
jgi:hypothetical protein